MMKVDQELFLELRELLVNHTGNSEAEVFWEAKLEEDLGLNLDDDLPRLVNRINHQFEVELDCEMLQAEFEEAGATVAALAKLINDERELG